MSLFLHPVPGRPQSGGGEFLRIETQRQVRLARRVKDPTKVPGYRTMGWPAGWKDGKPTANEALSSPPV